MGCWPRSNRTAAQALAYLDQARAVAEAAKKSTAPWDLAEFALRITRGEMAEADRLLYHIRDQHIKEPGVAQALYQILADAGIIGPDGRPTAAAAAAAGQGAPDLVVPGPAARNRVRSGRPTAISRRAVRSRRSGRRTDAESYHLQGANRVMPSEELDAWHMARALELAARGEGLVEPNPMVGCAIVRDGETVGEGWHQQFGGPHAEVEALRVAGARARGATAYVTLEPCCHQGKTPPCTQGPDRGWREPRGGRPARSVSQGRRRRHCRAQSGGHRGRSRLSERTKPGG